jgi:hypothetical protein
MQNQLNKVASTSYQTPQIKLSNSLIEIANNSEELSFVQSISHLTVLQVSQTDKNFWDNLIDILAKWRWMAGINLHNQSEDDIAKELALLGKFIFENYPNITYEEINLAINLSLTNKLDCDVRTFNTFSPMYVSRILNAYLEYKRDIYNDLMKRKETLDLKKEMDREITAEEKMQNMIELIRYFYDEYKSKGIVKDYFNTLYNYFRRTKRMSPDKNMVNDALSYAKEEAKKHIKDYFDDAFKKEKVNVENIEKRYARNYCVQVFFDNLDIEKLISTITIQEFQ